MFKREFLATAMVAACFLCSAAQAQPAVAHPAVATAVGVHQFHVVATGVPAVKAVKPGPDQFEQALADPKSGYHPIHMPNGVTLGPNIPGSMIVGTLQRTPTSERIAVASGYLLLLASSGAWMVFGMRAIKENGA